MEVEGSKRAKNFTDLDRNLLLEIAIQYKDIIEDSKASIKEKNDIWMEIAIKYNEICETGPRNAKQLRKLYGSIKKKVKKNLSDDKNNLDATDGGTFIPQSDGLDSKVVTVLEPKYESLPNSFDSSAAYVDEFISGKDITTSIENTNVMAEVMKGAGPIKSAPEESVDAAESSAEYVWMPSTAAQVEESPSMSHITPKSGSTKKRKLQSIELLSKRMMDRQILKDKLYAEIQKKKEEILNLEKLVKENQLKAINIDVLIKKAELKLREREIEVKEKEIQLKNEELLHARRIQEMELEIKEKDLEMKRWEYVAKEDMHLREAMFQN